ncbi:endonuclease domain-containing protein [Protofrankia symbiont of Coriaria ruscifolia]|nr:endonuclease domain-containing protein [Protofrankia symbiont of Coriaria ruscifolia]
MRVSPRRGESFRYVGYDIDASRNRLVCRYRLDGREFREEVTFPGGGAWDEPAVAEAARLVFLLAAVSYYKSAAPPVVDLGDTAVTDVERVFLREFYLDGLGEFAYRNNLDLSDLRIVGSRLARTAPVAFSPQDGRPLVPFGGGVDSIVTAELLRPLAKDPALFVVNRPGDRFDAIERPAGVTGFPVVRAERLIDPQLLRSGELGFLNGHVPVTGILSAIALMAAALDGRDAVVMSNEWSASVGTVEVDGRSINHQYSKGEAFENSLRSVLAETLAGRPDYFSLLRPFTELWIARRFAAYPQYFDHFRSCNRAFHLDPARRLDRWCGRCDKCCFIDLILAPFLDEPTLRRVFDGREPLADPALVGRFQALLGLSSENKPWECVGDVTECRVATLLAAPRRDRAGSAVLAALGPLSGEPTPEELLTPHGRHFVPDRYAPDDLLV